jgi:pyroglutamyl-peptidase
MNVLVTGFGPFPGVEVNPTAEVARALDGARVGEATVVGRVLPVSYRRGPEAALAAAREVDAALVLGLGVATGRARVCVERVGVYVHRGRPDVDEQVITALAPIERVPATVDCARLAEALDADLSDDAGAYVCNAWLHRVASGLAVPVGFVHVPAVGIAPERLLAGIAAIIRR